jgi:hypothetical protein
MPGGKSNDILSMSFRSIDGVNIQNSDIQEETRRIYEVHNDSCRTNPTTRHHYSNSASPTVTLHIPEHLVPCPLGDRTIVQYLEFVLEAIQSKYAMDM